MIEAFKWPKKQVTRDLPSNKTFRILLPWFDLFRNKINRTHPKCGVSAYPDSDSCGEVTWSNAKSIRIPIVLKPHFSLTNQPSVHKKPVNLLTETASFFKRSPEWFKAPFPNPPTDQICGFKNVRIRVGCALFSLVFLMQVAWPSGQRVGPQAT